MDVGQVRRDVQGSCVMKSVFEQIGKTPAEIEAKLQTAFGQLFEGDPENERVCFNHGDDLAYIVDIGHTDIRSEGMSYGMTIAALMGKRDLFDRLWNFSRRYMRNKEGALEGYYSWQVSTKDFSMMDPGPAPDGEEYFAIALIYGAKVFGCDEYLKEAVKLLHDMAYKPETEEVFTMMDRKAGLVRFSPMKGNDYTDPSYNTLAFYRMYGEACKVAEAKGIAGVACSVAGAASSSVAGSAGSDGAVTADQDVDFWKKIAANSFEYLKKACHPVTGMAADYSEFDGTPRKTPWHDASHCFCGDAWRVAWNIALDAKNLERAQLAAAGNGAAVGVAGTQPDNVAAVREWEIAEIRRLLNYFNDHRPYVADSYIDGSGFFREARLATGGLIGMNGAATIALPEGDPLIKPFAEDLWNLEVPTGTWRYYDGLLYMLGLLACSGKFYV